jgi:hypothetical protein
VKSVWFARKIYPNISKASSEKNKTRIVLTGIDWKGAERMRREGLKLEKKETSCGGDRPDRKLWEKKGAEKDEHKLC